jgi:hypothetical protein
VKKTDWLLIGFSCHLVIVMLWEITAVDVQWSGTKVSGGIAMCTKISMLFISRGERTRNKIENMELSKVLC